MKLGRQIKLLSWGTPISVKLGESKLYTGEARDALSSSNLSGYLDMPVKTLRLDKAVVSPVVEIIIKNGGLKNEG